MAPGSTLDALATGGLLLAGIASITFGLWQAWPPLAWVFGGLVSVVAAVGLPDAAPRPKP